VPGNLVFVAKLFGKTLGGNHAAKPATKDQNVRHL
jgi:hypothetical protein